MRITAENSVTVTLIAAVTLAFSIGAIMAGTAALFATAFGVTSRIESVGVPAYVSVLTIGIIATTFAVLAIKKAKIHYMS